jgi:hypothetical protein
LALFGAFFSPVFLAMAGVAAVGWLPKLRGGRMRVISVIEGPKLIKKILDHLHLPSDAPKNHQARAPPQMEFFDECIDESF